LNEGLLINTNFTGCIENLYMNSTNMIYLVKESYNSGDSWLMQKYQKINTLYTCLVRLLFNILKFNFKLLKYYIFIRNLLLFPLHFYQDHLMQELEVMRV